MTDNKGKGNTRDCGGWNAKNSGSSLSFYTSKMIPVYDEIRNQLWSEDGTNVMKQKNLLRYMLSLALISRLTGLIPLVKIKNLMIHVLYVKARTQNLMVSFIFERLYSFQKEYSFAKISMSGLSPGQLRNSLL